MRRIPGDRLRRPAIAVTGRDTPAGRQGPDPRGRRTEAGHEVHLRGGHRHPNPCVRLRRRHHVHGPGYAIMTGPIARRTALGLAGGGTPVAS